MYYYCTITLVKKTVYNISRLNSVANCSTALQPCHIFMTRLKRTFYFATVHNSVRLLQDCDEFVELFIS